MNIVDQYRSMAKYTAATPTHDVRRARLDEQGRPMGSGLSVPAEELRRRMAYYGQLKKEGKAIDLTMSEFADAYRADRPYTARMTSGRTSSTAPSASSSGLRIRGCVLPGHEPGRRHDRSAARTRQARPAMRSRDGAHQDASYPFVVQSLFRAGYFTHYAGEGAVKSCKVSHAGEEVDLCACRTQAPSPKRATPESSPRYCRGRIREVHHRLQTVFRLTEGTGEVEIVRKVVSSTTRRPKSASTSTSRPATHDRISRDLSGVRLTLKGATGTESIDYAYKCREALVEGIESAVAVVPRSIRSFRCDRTWPGRREHRLGLFPRGNGLLTDVHDRHQEDSSRQWRVAHMAQGRKGKLNFRCPRCLMREIRHGHAVRHGQGEYYCLRCSFVGPEAEVLRLNAEFRSKYLDERCGSRTFSGRATPGARTQPLFATQHSRLTSPTTPYTSQPGLSLRERGRIEVVVGSAGCVALGQGGPRRWR